MLGKDKFMRGMEMVPGSIVWATIIVAVVLSFVSPLTAIYVIIVFDLLWFFRVCYFVFYLALSWRRYQRDIKVDWLARAKAHPRFGEIYHLIFLPTYKEDIDIIRTTL